MDKVLITMPFYEREFFLAMPAVQDYIFQYVQEVHHGSRDQQYDFTFRMNDKFEMYEAPLKVAKENVPQFDYTGWSELNRSEFNCFISFDFIEAEKISLVTRKHIVESLGILIGSTPKHWPILPPPRNTQGKGHLILSWGDMDEALKVGKHFGSNCDVVETPAPFTMKEINDLDLDTVEAVIGPASVATYLAASYNRTVLEIHPNKTSFILYNNEGINNYQAIIGNPKAETVIAAWRNLCQTDFGYDTKWDELEILMEPQVSSVKSVEEK
jgi:hypothetical protein